MALTRVVVALFLVSVVYANRVRQQEGIASVEQYVKDNLSNINQRYRLHYHIMPPVGWLNDPNGFSYYKGQYHMFYQYYPFRTEWGPMHWGHYSSPDLVTWNYLPTALIPEEEMCFSGSALVVNDSLVLMYTGRINLEGDEFHEAQYLATSDDGVVFHKYAGNPVLALPSDSEVSDFRDPKTWQHGNYYYTVIGSKIIDEQGERGSVVLYRSSDLFSWEFMSILGEAPSRAEGYMWECPDFFEIDGKFVLLISPQGIEPVGDRYQNVYQNGYIIGSFNYETGTFVPETDFVEIDFGHDFYAAQTMEHEGKRYITAWFSEWYKTHDEAVDGWNGALTLVREVKLYNNTLLMVPVPGMQSLRNETVLSGNFEPEQVLLFDNTAEIILEGDLEQKIELLIEGRSGNANPVWIRWDPQVGKVVVDRNSSRENDSPRQVEWNPIGTKKWRLFLDTCSLELFCGEGEVVFSSRVYVDDPWKVTNKSPQSLQVESWRLRRSVPYNPENPDNSTDGSNSLIFTNAYLCILLCLLSKLVH